MTTMHSTPTATSTRSYSVLRFLLLLGSYSHLPSLADAVVAPLSQQCFTTRQELADALYDYLRDDNKNTTTSSSIETWCVSHISLQDDISDLRMEAELNLGIDLSTWEENNGECYCEDDNGETEVTVLEEESRENTDTVAVVVEEEEEIQRNVPTSSSSSPTRSASDTSTATATKIDSTSPSSTSNKSGNGNEMPMIYRLMPIKLLAVLLILSLGMAIRHMVDFHRYEGIDPSDQKNVEFELLQLAEEA